MKIAYVTGSRADYCIVQRYLHLLNEDPDIDLSILVTGALLEKQYGYQVDLIHDDGFNIDLEVNIDIDTSSNAAIINSMSITMLEFGKYFEKNKFDLLIILGDRYEMLSVAIAAAMQQIPILHIHGGEATFGNYDEFIRHSITKMSLYHFVATEDYRRRVIQLGEHPDNVFYLGSLGAENCLHIDSSKIPNEIKNLPKKDYFVVLFHPETITNVDVTQQVDTLLNVLDKYSDKSIVFLGTNSDTYSNIIRDRVKNYVTSRENTFYFENMHTDAYHFMLKNALCLIGNSSSGLIEAPSIGIYTINIGDRQKGRVRGNSVLDVECEYSQITQAINFILDRKKDDNKNINNPYYKKNAYQQYYHYTKSILKELSKRQNTAKVFYDN